MHKYFVTPVTINQDILNLSAEIYLKLNVQFLEYRAQRERPPVPRMAAVFRASDVASSKTPVLFV